MAGGGHPILKPIAWGHVTWAVGVPLWLAGSAHGGELGARTPVASGGGPTTTALVLDRAHDPSRLHVVVTPWGSGYAYEEPATRTGTILFVTTTDAATPFTVTVYEEQ